MSISRNWLYAIGTFIIAFILGTMLVLPIFDDRRGLDILLGIGKEEPVEPVGADAWLGISSVELDDSCDSSSQGLQDALDGINPWIHNVNEVHWFVLDLGQTYTIKKVRSWSDRADDPTDVNIYIDDNNPPTTLCEEGITTWRDTTVWVEITLTTEGTGRYIKVEVEDTEDVNRNIYWGKGPPLPQSIFDAYGDVAAGPPSNNAPYQSGEVPANASTGISLTPDLYVKCIDNDSSDEMNATWWSNSSSSWVLFASNETSFANNTNITQSNANFSTELTTYYWSVNLSDGTDWTNATYHFTTTANATWQIVDDTINGSIYNVSRWNIFDSTINGSIYNVSRWNVIDNIINGSIYNSTTWKIIDAAINGSIYNVSRWNIIDNAINGSIYNTSYWYLIDNNINGSIYNLTSWNIIDDTINGSIYNLSSWRTIDNTINGSIYNLTTWKVIDNTINGSIYNISEWYVIDNTINGSIYNVSLWNIIDSTINGSIYNLTTWKIIDNTINGSIYNITVANITISNPYPADESINIPVNVTLHITINHTMGYSMNLTWYTGNSTANCTHYLGSHLNVNNGTYYIGYHNASEVSTEYAWRVNVTDAYGNYVEEVYNFTTASTTGEIYAIGGIGGYGMGMVIAFSLAFALLFSPFIALLWRRKRKREE